LLYTTEKSGSVFIRTDQLDGETDWKLRKAVTMTQSIQPSTQVIQTEGEIVANPPNDLIYDFKGYFERSELSTAESSGRTSIGLKVNINDEELIPNSDKHTGL